MVDMNIEVFLIVTLAMLVFVTALCVFVVTHEVVDSMRARKAQRVAEKAEEPEEEESDEEPEEEPEEESEEPEEEQK